MKSILFTFFLLVIIGCNVNDVNQMWLKEGLTSEEYQLFINMTSILEEVIEEEYKGNSDKFLSKLEYGEEKALSNRIRQDCKVLRGFSRSTLIDQITMEPYDTIYFFQSGRDSGNAKGLRIIRVTSQQDTIEEYVNIKEGREVEEIIKEEQNKKYERRISKSSFIKSVEEMEDETGMIKGYIEKVKHIGGQEPEILARGIREMGNGLDDYVIKSILVYELFRKELRLDHGC